MNTDLLNFIQQTFSSIPNLLVVLLLSLVIVANGLSDAPNTIATCVSTKAISPKKAIIMSAIFNFLGIFIMSFISIQVAQTVFNLVEFSSTGKDALITLVGALLSILLWVKIMNKFAVPNELLTKYDSIFKSKNFDNFTLDILTLIGAIIA